MTDRLKTGWRSLLLTAAVVVGGVALGISAAPRAASADPLRTWSCAGTDECHDGTAKCCTMFTHCSTMCPG